MNLVPFPGLVVDPRTRLYIDRHGSSVEAISFDDVYETTNALAGRLKQPTMALARSDIGSVEAFRRYRALLSKAASELPADQTWYHPRTPAAAKQALEAALIARHRVRLYYGDPATGVDAMELTDTVGFIGRRGEILQYPVLLRDRSDRRGVRIRDNALVRIQLVDHHVDLWAHPHYRLPSLDVVPLTDGRARLIVDGKRDVDFPDDSSMNGFLRFIRSERHVLPTHLA